MLLYVSGDEISGGACCVNEFVQADHDIHHTASGNKAHPDNVMHSYGYYLSRLLNVGFRCEAFARQNNQEIYDSVENFIDNILPKLRSQYTVVVVGWKPGVDVNLLNDLADRLATLKIEYIFFNTSKPIAQTAKLSFGNYLDLTAKDDCFLVWCKNHGHALKNDLWPDSSAHNAWAKYLFSKMIEVL